MESRNVTLTLQKAKEFYNNGNDALKEVALQAFTKEELTTIPKYTDIKTFEDACKAIGLPMYKANAYIKAILLKGEVGISQHLVAIYKLDIIRKALNGTDWKPKIAEGNIYYGWVRFYKKSLDIPYNKKIIGKFIADGQKYLVVGCLKGSRYSNGLGDFCSVRRYGVSDTHLGLLCCKSAEIAQYMSEQFGKTIFEACYAQHIGTYEWVS